jgi:hypothetical protein
LHNEVSLGERVGERGAGRDAREHLLRRLLHAALGPQARERREHRVTRAPERRRRRVDERDVEARRGGDLRDAAAIWSAPMTAILRSSAPSDIVAAFLCASEAVFALAPGLA